MSRTACGSVRPAAGLWVDALQGEELFLERIQQLTNVAGLPRNLDDYEKPTSSSRPAASQPPLPGLGCGSRRS
jgi:hypothetical protein